MRSALKWITNQAKDYRRAHPSMTWKGAIKAASLDYRKGGNKKERSRKPARVKKIRKRATAKYSKRLKSKRVVSRIKKLHRAEGRAIRSLGSVSSHLHKAKKIIELQIGRAEVAKFKAHKKPTKRKISKRIAALKSKFRKLI